MATARVPFTGAANDRKGLLAEADGGILFLDEIQDLPKHVQRKLVRVFQDRWRRYRAVGSDQEQSIDVELVCASNLPITELRAQLDADLFDRLSHLVVRVPALSDCRDDLRDDWSKVWREVRQRQDLPETAPWSTELECTLGDHPLPGNLRDLQRLAVLVMAWWADGNVGEAIERARHEWSRWTFDAITDESGFGIGSRKDRTQWFQTQLAKQAKEQHGTWSAAAKALGCDEGTLRKDVAREANPTK